MGPKSIRSQIRGYIAEAPFIAVHPSSAPFKITVVIGRVLARLIPNLQMVQKLDSSLVSRDEQVCRDFEKDELCHDTGTLEGMGGMLDRAAELLGGKLKVGMTGEVGQDGEGSKEGKMSLLIAHGTADKITSFDATKKFVEESCKDVDDLEFRVFEGWFHKREFVISFLQ
ncbi:MAG: hypothetical protein M1823_001475 [Watsoniomyces obsoletus]|nr:MAG: hypothetical protein M1823_001475 [Watsoniomyces obsoletus]